MSIYPCHQSLASRFFVTSCTIYLSSKEKIFNQFSFEAKLELRRRKIVIFNGVPWSEHFAIFKTRHQFERFMLHLLRQRRRKTIYIDFNGTKTFGFYK